MLLQILEDGVLTDAKGRKIDFSNTVIIMTSNIGAQKLQKEANLGFSASQRQDLDDLDSLHEANKEKVHEELKKIMKPELINRIDKIIVFRALTKKDVQKILELQIIELRDRLIKHGLGLEFNSTAKHYLINNGYDAHNGARPLRRLIQDTVEDHIASGLLEGDFSRGDMIQISSKNDKLTYEAKRETVPA